jgi:hypothetical protein
MARVLVLLILLGCGAWVQPVAAQTTAPPHIDMLVERTDPSARIVPGGNETMTVRLTVTYQSNAYCFDPMRLDLKSFTWPTYATVVLEPASFEFRLQQPQPGPSQQAATTSRVNATMRVSISADAPARAVGVYGIGAELTPPEGVCNVQSARSQTQFGIVNDFRAQTHVRPIGWHPVYTNYYDVEVRSGSNGPTRIDVEPIFYDPMALGRIETERMVLQPNATQTLHILFSDIAPGRHHARLGIRTVFDGPPEANTDLDVVDVTTAGEELTRSEAEGRGSPAVGVLFLAVCAAGLAWFRRRWTRRE